MKTIRIAKRGVFREGGQMVPIGTEVTVPDDFVGWNGKWAEVSSDKGKTLEPATPAPTVEQRPDDSEEGEKVGGFMDDSLAELRDQYERVLGKRPGPRMKGDTMLRYIEEAQGGVSDD